MPGRSIFGRGPDDPDEDADDAVDPVGGTGEGVRIIDPDEAERVAERDDVAPRRGGDTPRYGDRPKGPPPGPKPALSFPLAGADDPASLDRPRAAPVPPAGDPGWSVPDEDQPPTEAVPIVAGEDIDGFVPGDVEDDTQAWSLEEDAEVGDGDGEDEYVYEYEYVEVEVDEDDPDVLSFDPPSEEVALPHWTEPATGEVPQVLVDDEADDERWASFAQGPRWRDQHEAWEGDTDLTGDLVDPDDPTDHSLGALDTSQRPTHEEFMTFDDLEVPSAGEHTVAGLERGDEPEDAGPTEAGTADDPIVIGSGGPQARPQERPRPGRPDPRGERPRGQRPEGDAAVRRRKAPAGRAPGEVPNPDSGGRDMNQAVVVGLGIAFVAILAFVIHPLLVLVLIEIVVVMSGIEYLSALRRGDHRTPALLGLTAIAALPLATYARGEAAIPLVLFLLILFSVLWYVLGAGSERPVRGIGTMLLPVLHVGVLGSFASLILTLGPLGGAIEVDQGVSLLLLAVLATVGHDVGAFFVGRQAGRKPLSPVSPNKTVEGVAGGIAAAFFAVMISVLVLGISELSFGQALVFGVVTALVAPIGDLAESLVKRDLGVKDMGGILPGHGGVFDRFDSMLFVLPTAYYLVRIFFMG